MDERKYVCKYCSKRFPCGKSLGGHIRTHMTEERSNNVDGDMLVKLDGVRKKRDLCCDDAAGNPIYGLRENPKKTTRFVHSGGDNDEQEERFCKECGKGFPSLKALCGHMACHSDKEKRTIIKFESSEKKLKLVMDSHSDTETSAPSHPRRSKRMRMKTINLSNHSFPSSSAVPLANGSSPVSEVEQEQEEVARCLMLLSRDSSFKGRFPSVTESSDNNSVILEAKSSSLDTRFGVTNGNNNNNFVSGNAYDPVEKKLLKFKDIKLKSVEFGASDNSGSRCFKYGPKTKMPHSDVSNDEFKWPKVGDKSRFSKAYDVESRKIVNRGKSKITAAVVKKLLMEDLDDDRTDGTARKFDSRKMSNYDSLSQNLVGVSSKKISNGFGNEVYENGSEGWKNECLVGERDNGSYDSIDGSDENSSETDTFPAPRAPNTKALNGKKSSKAKKKLKSKKSKEHECPICYKIFRSGQALGGHKRSHFIGGYAENSLENSYGFCFVPITICVVLHSILLPVGVSERTTGIIVALALMWAQDSSHQVESRGTQESNRM
ncbi:Zinc finger protein ZAT9, partial [Mucuna pruriens]